MPVFSNSTDIPANLVSLCDEDSVANILGLFRKMSYASQQIVEIPPGAEHMAETRR